MAPPKPASSPSKKRKVDEPISPPTVKRKAQSSISKSAVNSFFTPTSQKPKERTTWSERAPDDDTPGTLLIGRYEPENTDDSDKGKRTKIAAFDLDSTLIATASGKKHGDAPGDWKWWDATVPTKLKELYGKGYRIVILSNQAGLTLHADPKSKGPKNAGKDRVNKFKQKCGAVLTQLNLPTTLYAATGRDIFRKPRTGMWSELCRDYGITEDEIDLESSIFVGDAGGRTAQLKKGSGGSGAQAVAKDFSCSDRNFAHNVGITYRTPEEFFLDEPPRDFVRDFDLAMYPNPSSSPSSSSDEKNEDNKKADGDTADEILFEKKNDQELVLFVGPPGAGKSTFYWRCLEPLGYARINQDTLKSRAKCLAAAREALTAGRSAAVDNTNPDADGRAEWVRLARGAGVPVRCVWFCTPPALCEHNDAVRALGRAAGLNPEAREALPKLAFNGFAARFREPKAEEGFQDVVKVEFRFRGTPEEYAVWGRYWT